MIDHGDTVRHRQRFALIVRDVDGGHAQLLVQAAQLDLHVLAQLLVERRQRLVHQQNARLEHDRACQRHALALPARQLIDAACRIAGELHHRERRIDAADDIGSGNAAQPQRKGNICADAHVRKQRVGLEYHPDAALMRSKADHFRLAELQAAMVRPGKTGEHHQQCGFA